MSKESAIRPVPDARDDERASTPIAPAWHTAALVALILAVAITGAILQHRGSPIVAPAPRARAAAVYLPMIVVQAALAIYVCRVGRPRSAFAALVGKGWDRFGRACGDLALAGFVFFAIEASELLYGRAFAGARSGAATALLPATGAERLVWVVVAVAAGVGEELVYRGYLQTQLAVFTRRAAVGVALQAALFGIAHGDQGIATAIRFALYGVLLGVVARARASLIPGMIGHVGIDLASGLLR